jgi:hypothetical protein
MAGLDPAIHVFATSRKKGVDARVICAKTRFALLPGHDEGWSEVPPHCVIVIGEKSTNQLLGCTKPLIFGLMARGATSWAT